MRIRRDEALAELETEMLEEKEAIYKERDEDLKRDGRITKARLPS